MINGSVSHWFTDVPGTPPAAPLAENRSADVCIVGGGFTGLWTAYYLKKSHPELEVVVLEQRICGYGASGRNGGWLSGGLPGKASAYAKKAGRDSTMAMIRASNETVDEVMRVARTESIEAHIVKAGVLTVARSLPQESRLRSLLDEERAWGDTDTLMLDAAELDRQLVVDGARSAIWNPHCARVHPAKLVRGLARAVGQLGVHIYEHTPVVSIEPRRVRTESHTVTSTYVVRATEGFTSRLPGERRTWLPMNSSMIVTQPLSDDVWAGIGWQNAELLGDHAHAYMYAQHTADGRIAIGGRGSPYRFGSRIDTDGRTPQSTVDALRSTLVSMFPSLSEVTIDHAWSGVLGVPRDWCATVNLDDTSGMAWAGGYVGLGVAATNLAGRTLADLITGQDTDLTVMPWVGRTVRRWEPEPLRWLGVHTLYRAYRAADRHEGGSGTARTSPLAHLADRISGRA